MRKWKGGSHNAPPRSAGRRSLAVALAGSTRNFVSLFQAMDDEIEQETKHLLAEKLISLATGGERNILTRKKGKNGKLIVRRRYYKPSLAAIREILYCVAGKPPPAEKIEMPEKINTLIDPERSTIREPRCNPARDHGSRAKERE